MVFFSAFVFGWRAGLICGGIGSAAADVLLGYVFFSPITLISKGTEGFVAGIASRALKNRPASLALGVVVSLIGADFKLVYSTAAIASAFLCSSCIGILFGFLPARKAAHLDPVVALTRE